MLRDTNQRDSCFRHRTGFSPIGAYKNYHADDEHAVAKGRGKLSTDPLVHVRTLFAVLFDSIQMARSEFRTAGSQSIGDIGKVNGSCSHLLQLFLPQESIDLFRHAIALNQFYFILRLK